MPKHIRNQGVDRIAQVSGYHFVPLDLASKRARLGVTDPEVLELKITITMELGDLDGVLKVAAWVGKQEVASTNIDYYSNAPLNLE